MKGLKNLLKRKAGRARGRSLRLAAGVLLLVALGVAACGQGAPSTVLPTQLAAAAPTSAPTLAAVTASVTVALPPSAQPSAPAATNTPRVQPTASGPTPTVTVGEGEVDLEDFPFVPQVLTVKVGTRVKFPNKDKGGHTVTSDTDVFDSGVLQKGEEFFYTFTQAGEFPYYCAPHGGPGGQGMSGTIIVVP